MTVVAPSFDAIGVPTMTGLPEHWARKPLKYILQIIGDRGDFDQDRGRYIGLEHIESWSGKIVGNDETKPEGMVGYFQAGDILFGKLRPYLAKVLLCDVSGSASTEAMILRPRPGNHGRFYWYSLASRPFIQIVDGSTYGSKMPRANWDFVGSQMLPVPPLDEQQIIAAYLDRETGRIDALVERLERLIALLTEKRQAVISHAVTKGLRPDAPMKDSGIEWLGEVPTHWTIVRLGALFFEANERSNEHLPVLSVSIHSGVSTDEVSDASGERRQALSEDRSKYKAVLPGDLAYNMMRAWQGGFGAVTVEGAVSPAYIVARPFSSSELETAFVEGVLRTPHAVEEMRRHSKGITDFRLRLYWTEFKNMKIALPPLDEQRSILKHINAELDENAELADRIRRSIETLSERRSALISAAVTGQIPLAEMIPDAQPEKAT